VPIRLGVPLTSNFKDDVVNFQFYCGKALEDSIGKPLFNKVAIPKLEDFLLSFDLSLMQGSGHIVGLAHRRGGNMIELYTLSHWDLKFPRESLEEEAGTSIPVPIGAGTRSEYAVLDCRTILWVMPVPILPLHGLLS
jgi:hypothetical protein